MQTQIALLRGINVGGNNIIPMKELITLMESNGYANVRTYIQSGNVVYEVGTDKGTRQIGALIKSKYGFEPVVLTYDADTFRSKADRNPYPDGKGNRVHFFFCDRVPDQVDTDFLGSLRTPSEQYELIDDVLYLHAPDGIGRSKLVARIGKAFPNVNMTARNLNTVNKLLGMIE